MELLKVFLIALAGVFALMLGAQLFARWRAKKLVGREFRKFGRDAVVYFYSPNCGACQRMNPVIEELSKKVKVKKVDVSNKEGLQVASQLGVLGTPTTVVVRNGRVHKAFLGFQKGENILEEVKR
ncbi:thioredoxin family protein [Hydrogenivirga sp.]